MRAWSGSVVVLMVMLGCGVEPHTRLVVNAEEVALSTCEVEVPEGLTKLVASEHGVAFATRVDGANHVVRTTGTGCALTPSGPPLAGELLDLDDHGTVYVLPREADAPGVLGTVRADRPLTAMKVSPDDDVAAVIGTGRGLWSFGVSPGGETMWASSCGPTGIFTATSEGSVERLPAPDTLWEQRPALLTDDATFWSVGVRRCAPDAPLSPACAFALVRTTAEGSHEVGATLVDFGAGFEEGVLARCGHSVCGAFASGVVSWARNGAVSRRWSLTDLGAHDGEHVAAVTGTDRALYVTLSDAHATRVLFVPR